MAKLTRNQMLALIASGQTVLYKGKITYPNGKVLKVAGDVPTDIQIQADTAAENSSGSFSIDDFNSSQFEEDTDGNIHIKDSAISSTNGNFLPVIKMNVVGANVTGNIWTKTAPDSWTNSGFVSAETIIEGNVRIVIGETLFTRTLGFLTSNSISNYTDIMYGVFLSSNFEFFTNLSGTLSLISGYALRDILVINLFKDELGNRFFSVYKNGARIAIVPVSESVNTPFYLAATANQSGSRFGLIEMKKSI